ncbi:SagB/ThcOx family dehydrogenase [Achromobacter spanius]|uniref:SagB/ThcOx family dehydrogenase n=1 Tax=Achromobacter spanius TaxID=217203 RepID=UPI0036ED87E1
MTEQLDLDRRILSLNQIEHVSQFSDIEVEHFVRMFHHHCLSSAESVFEAIVDAPSLTPDDLRIAELTELHFSHISESVNSTGNDCPEAVDRSPSLQHGMARPIEFNVIASIFSDSMRADKTGRRPYPSGGALYSVEPVLICGDLITGAPPYSVLHYLPNTNKFEVIKGEFEENSYSKISSTPGVSFYIAYFMNIRKAIFKYRSRGYRLALLETGSMYQLVSAAAQQKGIASRVVSGFSDYQLTKTCGIDSRLMLPIIIQALGVETGKC